jgi:hypothetical protein
MQVLEFALFGFLPDKQIKQFRYTYSFTNKFSTLNINKLRLIYNINTDNAFKKYKGDKLLLQIL